MNPSNDQRRPVTGAGVGMIVNRSDHSVTRSMTSTQTPRIGGVVIVDLGDLPGRGPFIDADHIARMRFAALASAPTGADVIIRPGKFWPADFLFIDSGIDKMGSVTVESTDPTQIRRWTQCLREVLG